MATTPTSRADQRTRRARTDPSWAPLYWFRADYPYCIATTHKVASTTLANTLGSRAKFYEANTPPAGKDVLLVLRHPLDRLVSAFEWFVRGPHNIIPGGGARKFGHIDFPAFVRYALAHPNMHWTPQTYQHEDWRSYDLIALKWLKDWWPEHDLGPLLHRKKTDRRPWREYYDDAALFARCAKVYAEDIEAYEQACRQGIYTG